VGILTAYERVIAALEAAGCRRQGNMWTCPAHDDSTPSLSVTQGDGLVLIHCHAGCSLAAVREAADLSMGDLVDEVRPTHRLVATNDYVDETGDLLFQVVRYEPKTFCQRRPEGAGGWTWSLDGVRRVLYRLPELVAAVAAGERVFVVEGEKDAEAIVAAGGVATCNPGGAGKWREVYAKALRGAEVVIVADADEAGRTHAAAVAASLFGVAASVEVVEPGGGCKDAAEHLAAGLGLLDWTSRAAVTPTGDLLEDWPRPVPLDGPPPPPFPEETLGALAPWARAVAVSYQVPVHLPAVMALGCISAAVAGRARVRVSADWTEELCAYVAAVLPSGERKSPVVREAMAPVERWEAERREQASLDRAVHDDRVRIAERRLDRAIAEAAKADGVTERSVAQAEVEGLRVELANLHPPSSPRVLADDATPEALVSLMADHGGAWPWSRTRAASSTSSPGATRTASRTSTPC
jgi:putative DNA primase/helicase